MAASKLFGVDDESYLKTGTTIVGLSCRDGVVLAADTRSTSGAIVMDKEKVKVHPIAPRIFSCAAGTSADCDQLARLAARTLALQRLRREVAGVEMRPTSDCVSAARVAILDGLLDNKRSGGRTPSAVFLLGGVSDNEGPVLYQIESGGSTQRAHYAALGSGALDAIAVIENMIDDASRSMKPRQQEGCVAEVQTEGTDDGFLLQLSTEEATHVARKAVQAGILNDLGSGSHVDLCVITHAKVERWREHFHTAHEKKVATETLPIDEESGERPRKTFPGLDATSVMLGGKQHTSKAAANRNELLPSGVTVEFLRLD